MTSRHARRFMLVVVRFADKTDEMSVFPVSVLYELASPSTSESVLAHVMEGQVGPTVHTIREAKEAKQRARAAEQRASAELAALQERLSQERREAAAQIHQLPLEMEQAQQQLAKLGTPPAPEIKEVPVVPADVSAQLTALRRQVESLTAERDALVLRATELEARAELLVAKREEEQYARELPGLVERDGHPAYQPAQIPGPVSGPTAGAGL